MKKTANMQLLVQFLIHDAKTGKLIRKSRKKRSRSFVLQWMKHIEASIAHASMEASDNVTTKDTSNVDQIITSANLANAGFAVEAPIATTNHGIQVGTGTTAPVNADYTVETLIAEGAGAGQMNYGAVSVLASGEAGANVDMIINRAISNNSGGSITVKEVTIVCKTATYYFLLVRDACDQIVTDGQVLTVQYTFRTTV